MIRSDWPVLLSRMWQRLLSFGSRPRVARIVLVSLFGLVLCSLVVALLREWDQVKDWLYCLTVGMLLKVFAVYTAALALAVLTWYLIMRRLSNRANIGIHLRIYCITNLARRLPGILWHVVGRVVLYEQAGLSKTETLLASGIEQVLIVLSGTLVYLASLAMTAGTTLVNITWLIMVVVAGSVMVHPQVIGAVLRRCGRQEAFSVQYQDLAIWLGLYIIIWVIGGYMAIILVGSNQPLSLAEQVQIIGAWSLSGGLTSLVTFLPAGLGLREVSLVMLLGPSIGWSYATFIAITLRLMLTLFEVIWGIVGWQMGRLVSW